MAEANTAGVVEEYDLPKPRYAFGVSWRDSGRHIDIDLQCVVVDNAGVIIDCAYYNNLKAVRAITHSGDETAGKPTGIQELIWANLNKLPAHVSVLVFVVAAYSGGLLQDVQDGRLHVFEEREVNEIGVYEMERSAAGVDVVAAMVRTDVGWKMRIIEEPAEQGQHFMDILPLLSRVIGTFLPNAPKRQKVAFAMEKGGVLDMPLGMNSITVGLGWGVDEGEVDLDVSAVLLDQRGSVLEAVFFGHLESAEHGIVHSGDNLTGEGEGDDEQIRVDLLHVGLVAQQVFFVVNIYSQNKTFRQVASPYCRIVEDASGSELCRYSLSDAGSDNGLIIAKMAREVGGRWGFHALGLPCRGRTYKDSLPQIQEAASVKTRALMLQGGAMEEMGGYADLGAFQGAARDKVVMAHPLPNAETECCSVQ
ncbi:unnamed protein product [Effrenium voratum]|nr:unnamed protein product [Effrenium voratum]